MFGLTNLSQISAIGVKGAGAFSPNQLPGLALWLDASDTSTLNLAGGTKVTQWEDKVSGLIFNQGTDAARPTLGTINGLNAVSFDGVDDNLRLGSQPFSGATGIAFVVFQRPAPMNTSNGNIFSMAQSTGTKYVIPARYEYLTSNPRPSIGVNDGTASLLAAGGTAIAADTTYIMVGYQDGVSLKMQMNNTVLDLDTSVTGSQTTKWIADVSGLDRVGLGYVPYAAVSARYGGLAGEILYCDGVVLTDSQISATKTYLAAKWGVTL